MAFSVRSTFRPDTSLGATATDGERLETASCFRVAGLPPFPDFLCKI